MTLEGNGPIRVVIDTSILVPILTYEFPSSNWLVQMWQSRLIEPLICDETLDELEEKLLERSPTAKEYPARKFVERALRQYTPWCRIIPPQDSGCNPRCEDETDQKFIDLACAGTAEVLITRDDKLLSMDHATAFLITNDRGFRNMTPQGNPTSFPPNTVGGEDT